MKELIISAIKSKSLLAFSYENYDRVVEPHCLGISVKGNLCLRGYQVAGNSSTGILGWKLYDVSKIDKMEELQESFLKPRVGYKKGDIHMSSIIIEL
jgi:predicted DNA-binding transcriptional regulator YafY